jgi:glyceraldehyde 3-phosphate dehydrogenase
MSVRIGINGFGRMGRLGLRAARGRDGLEFVRINEIATDAAGSAHRLKFDSVHGIWGPDCTGEGDAIRIDGQAVARHDVGPCCLRSCRRAWPSRSTKAGHRARC